MVDGIKFNIDTWNVKILERTRGRMKIDFKLSKEEAESYKNWMSMVRPEGVTDEQFVKTIFFQGIAYLNEQLQHLAERERERLAQEEAIKAVPQAQPDSDISVSVTDNPLTLVKNENEEAQ